MTTNDQFDDKKIIPQAADNDTRLFTTIKRIQDRLPSLEGKAGKYLKVNADEDGCTWAAGGGGGGTTDYEELDNKPKINSVELVGDKSASDLQLLGEEDVVNELTSTETKKPLSANMGKVLNENKIETAGTGLTKSGTTLNHSNAVTAQATQTLGKIAYDAQGHVTGSTAVTTDRGIDITSNAIGHTNAVTAQSTETLDKIAFDAQGHITGATAITTDRGLDITSNAIGHTNAVTAGTDKFGKVSYDAQGHVSAFTDVTLPKTGGIEIDSSNQLVHANDDITAIANNTLVALSCDLKGHITGYAERPIVTAWSATTADTNIPSEKLVDTALHNIDVDNLKTQATTDVGKSFVIKSDGTWEINKATSTPDDVTIENNSDDKLALKDGSASTGITIAKFNTSALSTAIGTTTVDTKVPTEKAVKDYVDGFAKTLEFTMDATTFVLTAVLKDADGTALSTQTVDLPLEQMVVNVEYDNTNQRFIITLKDGSKVYIPATSILRGVVTETATQTLTNKTIDADSNTLSNIETDNLKSGVLVTTVRASASASDTSIPSEKATRTQLDTKIDTAGTGLSKSGTTLNHSNSVTAETTGKLGLVQYDAQGHVTAVTERPIVSSFSATTLDTNIPSEKLVKTELDKKANTPLAGTSAPTSSQGEDGDVYMQYLAL